MRSSFALQLSWRFIAGLGAIAGALALGALAARAQQPPPAPPPVPEGPAYVVTYVEINPESTGRARDLLRQFAQTSRTEMGNRHFVALQRIGRENHFVLLELWDDHAAQQAHAQAERTIELRETLAPMQISPYDERPHAALSVAPGGAGEAAVYAVTHVDIVPTFRDAGTALVRGITEQSRRDTGNLRFDALTQNSRTNHMTLVEAWQSEAAQTAHIAAMHTRRFRDELTPLSGSLYDERLYRPL